MKKNFLVILLASLSLSATAQQQGFVSPPEQGYSHGGFNGPKPGLSSVARAKTLRDDAWVVLEGNIVKQIGHELYEFRDNSGTVYVDIDDKYWLGNTVSPDTRVRIEGEVDKDWNSTEIDVKNIQILK
ncbi:YgiW/YdeI family stress tolerance OB fold protein [Salmonella enterica]|nr:YgiW/YdeI family stress tolerance OB fold protein [Salmonella enterica]EDU1817411.1 YgiW/YdeI family stress tolerance OB fold protein [Salmonella enterica subsp. enterica serovar Sandiego]EAU2299082.1 YgiW/YdeI family stress tolerance OB fold protein [Salmonella enterica]EAU5653501.1 YgiW/YdeI family stress tolerance OB fold protein [Salmonella enterica]EAV6214527.1 YgiW/YdeI family stress tolerance OB fold protein [Salmonella enterica]